MATSRLTSFPKYVATDDSAPVEPVAWQTPFFKLTVLTFTLAAITVVSLYFVGVIDGTAAVEAVVDEDIPVVVLDVTTDLHCKSYSMVVDWCTDVSVEEINKNGCISYVQTSGKICVRFDDKKKLCVANDDCSLVKESELSAIQLNGPTMDSLCESYSIVVDACADVSVEEIAENGCMSYVESTGGICVNYDGSKTSCIVNQDCDTTETKGISVLPPSTSQHGGAIDGLCESYSLLVDACIDVSVEEIAKTGCMSYVDSTGRVCKHFDNSKTLCVANEECQHVDTSHLP